MLFATELKVISSRKQSCSIAIVLISQNIFFTVRESHVVYMTFSHIRGSSRSLRIRFIERVSQSVGSFFMFSGVGEKLLEII